jgi:pimeloyl-ACP methyl ester carboxylesterase
MAAPGGASGETALHVTRWGAAGPRIVLVHGGVQGGGAGGDRHFAAQQRLAARGFQLLVPDRPGHGRSPDPGRPDDAAADGALVAPLLADGAHLVGHSFGGCVVLDAASRRPEAVRSLTLIEPAMQRLATHDPHVRRFLLRLLGVMLLSWSAAARARRFTALVGVPPEIGGARGPEEEARMGRNLRRMVIPSKEALGRQLDLVRERRLPLTVVTGGWSPAFEAVGDAVAVRGGGRRVVIRSPHHFPHLVSGEFDELLAQLAAP